MADSEALRRKIIELLGPTTARFLARDIDCFIQDACTHAYAAGYLDAESSTESISSTQHFRLARVLQFMEQHEV